MLKKIHFLTALSAMVAAWAAGGFPVSDVVAGEAVTEWEARYNGPGISSDRPETVAVDGAGNAYLLEQREETGTGRDYGVVKYDPDGNELWAALYNGPGNGPDYAEALALDGAGNLYVTGKSDSTATYPMDYATIKYDAAGQELWVARYNGTENRDDWANAVAVDGAGHVYVTGETNSSGYYGDYGTIKYDAAGQPLWVATYDGVDGLEDRATHAAVDGSGNVYVAGNSRTTFPAYEWDYATVKYDADGNELWVARYDGPGHGHDEVTALALDDLGNAYVTGTSENDYLTIKYGPDGTVCWIARYDGPSHSVDRAWSLALDPSGSVYVTGESSDPLLQATTIKYDEDGNEVWVARHEGSPGISSGSVVRWGDGIVYVTGSSDWGGSDCMTMAYDPDGNELWAAIYDGPDGEDDFARALAVDPFGNVWVAGESTRGDDDSVTVKYDAGGNELWVAYRDGTGNADDAATAVDVDDSGHVYVIGTSRTSKTGKELLTAKYDADGNELWVVRYDGPYTGDDHAAALAAQGSGGVWVAGSTPGSAGGRNYTTIRYGGDGNELWVARYDGPGAGGDSLQAMAVDGTGHAYVTGKSAGATDASDYATVKYDADGNELWAVRYNGPVEGYDEALAVALDGAGNVYVTGSSQGTAETTEYLTVKYDGDGNELWTARAPRSGTGSDVAVAVAVDGTGNVYVTGSSVDIELSWWPPYIVGSDYKTVKYDGDGNELWTACYNGPAGGLDTAVALALDPSGGVFVTGSSAGGTTGSDFATIKYDADGNVVWTARYDGPAGTGDLPSALALDEAGNVYVTGASDGLGTIGSDYATVKYDPAGNQLWVARHNGLLGEDDAASGLALDGSGNVYVTGTEVESWERGDICTVKYSQPETPPPWGAASSAHASETASRLEAGSGPANYLCMLLLPAVILVLRRTACRRKRVGT